MTSFSNPTVGRNSPCPCGSGKRYKQCCGALASSTASEAAPSSIPRDQLPAAEAQAYDAFQRGDLATAQRIYRQILATDADNFDATHILGLALFQLGQFAEAETSIRRALKLRPKVAMAYNSLGMVLQAVGKSDEAKAAFGRAAELDPGNAVLHLNLGNVYRDTGDLEAAEPHYRRAVAADSKFAEAHNSLGVALTALGRWDEAEQCLKLALKLAPKLVNAYINLGELHRLQGRLEEARDAETKALQLDPNSVIARFDLSLIQLALGDFENGWRNYEARWAAPPLLGLRPGFSQPLWDGGDIAGKTILLYPEQGLGDTLQFVRYAQVLSEQRGARVIVTSPPELAELLRTVPGVEAVITERKDLPAFDVYCPMLSVPRHLGTTLETIPANIPYLAADPERVAAWRARLPDDGKLKIGLVWAGNARISDANANRTDSRRSLKLAQLSAWADIPGVTWISLQKGPPGEEARRPGALPLLDWTDELQSFADTAALAQCLDLIVSVDTSVVHMAGGLGKPVWMLSRFDACWRWLPGRTDSPWYPAMRIFTQPRPGDWEPVFRDVAVALRERF
jgi:tetratricopeptide (TPR) repeat protein